MQRRPAGVGKASRRFYRAFYRWSLVAEADADALHTHGLRQHASHTHGLRQRAFHTHGLRQDASDTTAPRNRSRGRRPLNLTKSPSTNDAHADADAAAAVQNDVLVRKHATRDGPLVRMQLGTTHRDRGHRGAGLIYRRVGDRDAAASEKVHQGVPEAWITGPTQSAMERPFNTLKSGEEVVRFRSGDGLMIERAFRSDFLAFLEQKYGHSLSKLSAQCGAMIEIQSLSASVAPADAGGLEGLRNISVLLSGTFLELKNTCDHFDAQHCGWKPSTTETAISATKPSTTETATATEPPTTETATPTESPTTETATPTESPTTETAKPTESPTTETAIPPTKPSTSVDDSRADRIFTISGPQTAQVIDLLRDDGEFLSIRRTVNYSDRWSQFHPDHFVQRSSHVEGLRLRDLTQEFVSNLCKHHSFAHHDVQMELVPNIAENEPHHRVVIRGPRRIQLHQIVIGRKRVNRSRLMKESGCSAIQSFADYIGVQGDDESLRRLFNLVRYQVKTACREHDWPPHDVFLEQPSPEGDSESSTPSSTQKAHTSSLGSANQTGLVKDGASNVEEGASNVKSGASDVKKNSDSSVQDGASKVKEGASNVKGGASDAKKKSNSSVKDGASKVKEGASNGKHGASKTKERASNVKGGASNVKDSSDNVASPQDSTRQPIYMMLRGQNYAEILSELTGSGLTLEKMRQRSGLQSIKFMPPPADKRGSSGFMVVGTPVARGRFRKILQQFTESICAAKGYQIPVITGIPGYWDSVSEEMSNEDKVALSDNIRLASRALSHPVVHVTASDPLNQLGGLVGRARGLTVSSFNTVSLSPDPIISFNIKLPSRTWTAISTSGRLAVVLLSATPRGAAIAHAFTKPYEHPAEPYEKLLQAKVHMYGNSTKKVRPMDMKDDYGGVLAQMRATLLPDKCVEVGDHLIVVAKVTSFSVDRAAKTALGEEAALSYVMQSYRGSSGPIEPPEFAWPVSALADQAASSAPQDTEAELDSDLDPLDLGADDNPRDVPEASGSGLHSQEQPWTSVGSSRAAEDPLYDALRLTSEASKSDQEVNLYEEMSKSFDDEEIEAADSDSYHARNGSNASHDLDRGATTRSTMTNRGSRSYSTSSRRLPLFDSRRFYSSHSSTTTKPNPSDILNPETAHIRTSDYLFLPEDRRPYTPRVRGLLAKRNAILTAQSNLSPEISPYLTDAEISSYQNTISSNSNTIAKRLAWNATFDLRVMLDKGRYDQWFFDHVGFFEQTIEKGQAVLLEETRLLRKMWEEGRIREQAKFEEMSEKLQRSYEVMEVETRRLKGVVADFGEDGFGDD